MPDSKSGPERFTEALPPQLRSRIASFAVFDEIASTSDYLLSQAPPPAGRFGVCLAAEQTAGRGRRGASWVSPGGGVYLSVSCPLSPSSPGWLGLMTAVELADGLSRCGVSGIGVKWPNDLYRRGRKLAGILVDLRAGLCVIGIGVNVALPDVAGRGIAQPWTDLAREGAAASDPVHIAAAAVEASVAAAGCTASASAAAMQRRFEPLDLLRGRRVEVTGGDGHRFAGIAQGVDDSARLCVESGGAVELCHCAEVSVRL